jgi:CheY-like chemotaxis protein
MNTPDQVVILIAEDLEDDLLLIKRALRKAQVFNPIQTVRNGEQVIAYLKGEGQFANRAEYPLPGLLLLDLKMPRMDGFEVLTWIRQEPNLRALRVIVLTSSGDMRDVTRAYELGANSFLVKPMDFDDYTGIGRFLNDYWLRTDRSPEITRPPRTKSSPRGVFPIRVHRVPSVVKIPAFL